MFGSPYLLIGAFVAGMAVLIGAFSTGYNFAYKAYKVQALQTENKVLKQDLLLAKAGEADAENKAKELENGSLADDQRIAALEKELAERKDVCLATDADISILRRGRR